MQRILNLSFCASSMPEGYGRWTVKPRHWVPNESTMLQEPIGKDRSLADLLAYYYIRYYRIGPFYGEIFNLGTLTSKPYGTYITYTGKNRHLGNLPITRQFGRAVVIDLQVGEREAVTETKLKEAASAKIKKGDIVILRTNYSACRPQQPSQKYFEDSPVLSFEAAAWLVGQNIKMVTTDMRSIESYGENSVHSLFNTAGIPVVEDLANLSLIKTSSVYLMVGAPLPIFGAPGGPVRVIAFEDINDLQKPLDLTHPLYTYPEPESNSPYAWELPIPDRIEPREYHGDAAKWQRMTPFQVVQSGKVIGQEAYFTYSHGSTTHVEGPYLDPLGEYGTSDEILRRYKRMPFDRLVGPAALIDLREYVGARQLVHVQHLKKKAAHVREGDIAFIRTGFNDWYLYGGGGGETTPGLTPEAAEWLAERKIRALAFDMPSIERSEPLSTVGQIRFTSNENHYIMHNADIPVVDWGINFSFLRKDRFIAAILALPAVNQPSAVPAQLIAIENWD
ncbi:MAG TPA: hypothetical protein DDW50_11040 [Firmicutes bacterium]|jgi:kynurenine formamidase|nr:hypothetical protein [Bacillota bacterium]